MHERNPGSEFIKPTLNTCSETQNPQFDLGTPETLGTLPSGSNSNFSRLGVGTERVGGTECVGGVVFQEEPVVSRHQQNSGFTEFSSGYVQENVRDLQLEPPAGTTARNLHLEPSA